MKRKRSKNNKQYVNDNDQDVYNDSSLGSIAYGKPQFQMSSPQKSLASEEDEYQRKLIKR